jgi:PAS domain S-box-containing protein
MNAMFGYEAGELIGKHLTILNDATPEENVRIIVNIHTAIEKNGFWEGELHNIRKDGTAFDTRARITTISSPENVWLVSVQEDITQRMQYEKDLQISKERYRTLSLKLMQAQEEERRRIGSELHDEIGQLLTGLKLSIAELGRKPPERLQEALNLPQNLIDQTIEKLRILTHSLVPNILVDLGLGPALEWHFQQYERQTGIRIHWKRIGLNPPCPCSTDVRVAAYRIVQEALTNVARHAEVKEVNVETVMTDNILNLKIQDFGCGFSPAIVQASYDTIGLVGIRERVLALGGEIKIESKPDLGTRIEVILPCIKDSARSQGKTGKKETSTRSRERRI